MPFHEQFVNIHEHYRLGASVTNKVFVLHPPPPPQPTDDTLDFLKE